MPCMQDAELNQMHPEQRSGSVRCAQSHCRGGTKGTRGAKCGCAAGTYLLLGKGGVIEGFKEQYLS